MEILKLKQNISKKPKLYYYRKFPIKLLKNSDSIIDLKLHYKKKFTPLKLNYILPDDLNIDSKWNPIARAIEQYLDILITPYEYICENSRVRKSICIIGAREQLLVAGSIFNSVYCLYTGSVERKTRNVRLAHRQLRRRMRREGDTKKHQDARVKISSFKSRLLSFLTNEIRLLTDELNRVNPEIKIKGYLRRKRIKSYIWGKYKKKWKTRL